MAAASSFSRLVRTLAANVSPEQLAHATGALSLPRGPSASAAAPLNISPPPSASPRPVEGGAAPSPGGGYAAAPSPTAAAAAAVAAAAAAAHAASPGAPSPHGHPPSTPQPLNIPPAAEVARAAQVRARVRVGATLMTLQP